MTEITRESPRYHELVARYEALLSLSVGHARSVEAVEASPDGRLVAVSLRFTDGLDGEGHLELHLLAADGSGGWPVTAADGDASDPRWSCGGSLLTFLADHGSRHRPGPWAVEVATDGRMREPRRLASPPGFAELQRPSPDGTRLLLVMAGEHAEQADGLGSGTVGDRAARAAGEEGQAAPPAWTPLVEATSGQDEWRTTWLLDVATGTSRRVSPEGLNTWEADWLGPDAAVAIVSDAPAEDAWYGARLARLDLETTAAMTLYEPEWQIQYATGSPDGTRVAVIEAVASDRYYTEGDVMLVASDGTSVRTLKTRGVDIGAVRWIDDGRLGALGIEGMEVVAGVLDLNDRWHETWRGPAAIGGPYDQTSPVGGAGDLAAAIDGAGGVDRVAILGLHGERVLRSLDHPAQASFGAAMAEQRVVTWAGRDGTRVEGLLRLPHGTAPFATILWVHGGPVGAVLPGTPGIDMAMLLEAGYAILLPNPRGSTGRGRAFAAAVVGDMGGEDAWDLIGGIDHLVEAGVADADRLAVAGFSYGGYMAALLPSLTDRFAVAVVGSPLTDLISSYYASSLTVFVRDYVGGHPATHAARYVERSPVFARERLRTPTLITAGLRDRATPSGQAVELFRALREQGTDAELVLYPQEGHGVSDLAARADWAARAITWLEKYAPPRRSPG
ncbi:MAG TPA: prolyl oligopeptidase family serine peptidase [Candidatus Limnocylindrales bacterium]|nr:prolyl oligopeptidase family serine peptidase [Candidatus Limnocylindrales bacterium]